MTALSNVSTAISASATEGDLKSFLLNQYNYLAELFGTDGVKATAKSTLGIADGVTSLNGNTGAITAAQIAAAAVAGLGYTPGKNGATFTFALFGTFNPNGVNIYATYGPGVYAVGPSVYPITPSKPTIDINSSVTIYKLSKD